MSENAKRLLHFSLWLLSLFFSFEEKLFQLMLNRNHQIKYLTKHYLDYRSTKLSKQFVGPQNNQLEI